MVGRNGRKSSEEKTGCVRSGGVDFGREKGIWNAAMGSRKN